MNGDTSTKALIFRIALILYIIAVAYLCFANMNNIQHIPRRFLNLETDKVAHFFMFFPFPILGFLAYGKQTVSDRESLTIMICICAYGIIFAGLTELIQGMMPHRTEDIRDYRADMLAIVISSLATMTADIIRHHRHLRHHR